MTDTDKKSELHLAVLIAGLLFSLLFLILTCFSMSLSAEKQMVISYIAGAVFILIILAGIGFEKMKISRLRIREQLVLNLLAISSLYCSEELFKPGLPGWIILFVFVVWLVMLGFPTIQSCISSLFKKKH